MEKGEQTEREFITWAGLLWRDVPIERARPVLSCGQSLAAAARRLH